MIGIALFWGATILGIAWLIRDGVASATRAWGDDAHEPHRRLAEAPFPPTTTTSAERSHRRGGAP